MKKFNKKISKITEILSITIVKCKNFVDIIESSKNIKEHKKLIRNGQNFKKSNKIMCQLFFNI